MTEANNDTYCKTDDGSRMTPKRFLLMKILLLLLLLLL